MSTVIEKWDEILGIVKKEHDLSDVRFDTWLKPLKVYDVSGNVVTIVASDQVRLSYINKNYKLPLQVTISEVTGMTDCEVKFILPEDVPAKKSISDAAPDQDNRFKARCEEANLNPKYTFNTFIVGSNNKLAQAAALAVAESPGNTYNPLFIYGGAGLGKTHLMHSIAHFIIENDDNSKVLYVTSEEFTNELIETIRNGNNTAMSKFREKYRNIDVLLIDDIQFIIGKESTQEEFFHTFNTLYNAGKQIVLVSDRPPKEIKSLEERLRTRFEWGLIVDVQPPDYETRFIITREKALELGIELPQDVVDYISENITNNVRQIEGTVKKIKAYHDLTGMPLDITNVSRAIKDMYKGKTQAIPTPDLIISEVCRFYSIDESTLRSTLKNKGTAEARQVAMYLIRKLTNLSLPDIAKEFGKNHTTVLYALKKVEQELPNSSNGLQDNIRDITSNINSRL